MLLAYRLERLLRFGTLTVIDAGGTYRIFGDGMEPAVTIRLADRHLPLALLVDAELALPEAYMDGRLTIERGSLYMLLDLMVHNLRHRGPEAGFGLRAHLRSLVRSMRRRNPIGRAQANVAHHYDLSDELYRLFLDTERGYSCAFFETGREDLETAQRAKERRIAAKLLLRPGMRVLDIGSGWGALTRHLCELAGRQIDLTGITLSREQHAYAVRRAEEVGLAERLDYQLVDYRQVKGRFDRIVSVGMFEHVGVPHYDEYFQHLRELLTDDGIALVHSIGRAHGPYDTMPFIRKYIFPGGYIPALSEVLPAIERARLWVTDLEVLRLHYARTLRCWRERLAAHQAAVEALYDARFYRMWEFYLVASELFFSHEDGMVFQIQLSADRNAVPLTRDYLLPQPPAANRNLAAEMPRELDRAS
ncbi:MAG: cyclopropane-fatty-acyl-phospholipid synthase family protein [Geminicoccaceae bacterium]